MRACAACRQAVWCCFVRMYVRVYERAAPASAHHHHHHSHLFLAPPSHSIPYQCDQCKCGLCVSVRPAGGTGGMQQ